MPSTSSTLDGFHTCGLGILHQTRTRESLRLAHSVVEAWGWLLSGGPERPEGPSDQPRGPQLWGSQKRAWAGHLPWDHLSTGVPHPLRAQMRPM